MKVKKRFNFSISTKFTMLLMLIVLLLGISTMVLSYFIVKNSNLKDMDEALHDKSLILSESIDKEMMKSILQNPSEENPDAIRSTKEMDAVNDASDSITNLYTITMDGDKFHAPTLSSSVLKTGAVYNQDMIEAGISADLIAKIKQVYEKKTATSTEIYADEYGKYKTGLAPILDDDGSVLAVYAVDYDVSKVTAKAWSETLIIFYITIVFIVISAIIIYFIVKRKFAPIKILSNLSEKVAKGDLNIELIQPKTNDEMGSLTKNFNLMIESLKSIIQSVTKGSTQIAKTSHILSSSIEGVTNTNNQIVASIQEIASGSESQVEKANQSSRVIEEMSIGIQRIAQSATVISESTHATSLEAEKGNDATARSVVQMKSISKAVNESANIVKVLGERSEKVEEIVGMITGIASQTNLLALNAAIEAARAGEAGSGFAVVAEEVRKLAEQSDGSARQISEIISQIQVEIMESVKMMETAVKEVDSGIQIVNESEQAFGEISDSIRDVADQIQDLTATFEEMAAGTEEVTQSVQHMEKISRNSRDNTKSVAESSLSQLDTINDISDEAKILNDLSSELQSAINTFKLN